MNESKTPNGVNFSMPAAIVLSASAIVTMLVSMSPSLRNRIRSEYFRPSRKVLSVVKGDLLNSGQIVKAVKYETVEGIVIEILGSNMDGARSLVDRINIPKEHDGYFNFYGQASQLAIMDVDEDGSFELVAPTFDSKLVAHLNVFKYNKASQRFEPIQAPD